MRPPVISFGFLIIALLSSVVSADFQDTFVQGINTRNWTVSQTTPGLYFVGTSSDGLNFSTNHTTPTGFQNAALTLNLSSVTGSGSVAGDFSTSVSFSKAVLAGGSINQAELQTGFQDGKILFASRSNEQGNEVHVWNGNGSLLGLTPVSTNFGTFRIARVGSTLSGYYNGSLMYSMTETSPLTTLRLVLQNFNGNDPISISYTNFSLSGAGVIPEPSSILGLSLGLGTLLLASRLRRTA